MAEQLVPSHDAEAADTPPAETPPAAAPPTSIKLKLLSSSAADSSTKAGLISSILNLANTVMGSGLLTLPSAFASCGIVSGLLLAAAAAAANVLTLQLLYLSSSSAASQRPTLGSLAFAAFGKAGSAVVDAGVVVNGLGVCTGYLIVATDSLVEITNGARQRAAWTLLAACLVTPLSLLRAMDSLRFTSTLAVVSLGVISVVVVVYSAAPDACNACGGFAAGTITCHADDPKEHHLSVNGSLLPMACPGEIDWAPRPLMPTVRALSKFVLAFGCQQNLLPIVSELREPTPPRVLLVCIAAISIALLCYVTVATAGYLTFGHSVCSNVLNTYARTPAVAIVRALIAAVVLTSYPLLAFEARGALVTWCRRWVNDRRKRRRAATEPSEMTQATGPSAAEGETDEGRPSAASSAAEESGENSSSVVATDSGSAVRRLKRVFVSTHDELLVVTMVLGISTILALIVHDLGTVLGFIGASCGFLISFIVPSACFLKLTHRPGKGGALRMSALITLVVSVALVPLAVTIQLIYDD